MVSEIKLDGMEKHYFINNKPTKDNSTYPSNHKESVTVSNQLTELVKSVNSYDEPIHQSTLNDIQSRIKYGEYQINLDKLSSKLLNSGII